MSEEILTIYGQDVESLRVEGDLSEGIFEGRYDA